MSVLTRHDLALHDPTISVSPRVSKLMTYEAAYAVKNYACMNARMRYNDLWRMASKN